ncbi:MAG TPA: hypothetical protein VGI82_04940, partial [Chitinophagaceae bacterium]
MYKKWSLTLVFYLAGITMFAQVTPKDTSLRKTEPSVIDTSINYDDVTFDELEEFLDSILAPHSYVLTSFSVQKGYYDYKNKSDVFLDPIRETTFTPAAGYYNKNGLGITGIGSFVNDQGNFR